MEIEILDQAENRIYSVPSRDFQALPVKQVVALVITNAVQMDPVGFRDKYIGATYFLKNTPCSWPNPGFSHDFSFVTRVQSSFAHEFHLQLVSKVVLLTSFICNSCPKRLYSRVSFATRVLSGFTHEFHLQLAS